jgi:hypothetical protein
MQEASVIENDRLNRRIDELSQENHILEAQQASLNNLISVRDAEIEKLSMQCQELSTTLNDCSQKYSIDASQMNQELNELRELLLSEKRKFQTMKDQATIEATRANDVIKTQNQEISQLGQRTEDHQRALHSQASQLTSAAREREQALTSEITSLSSQVSIISF